MDNYLATFIKSLDLSTTFVLWIIALVIIGQILTRLIFMKNRRVKALAKNFLLMIFLAGVAPVIDFVANSSLKLTFLYGVEIIIAIIAFALAVSILFRFYDLLERSILYAAMVFGVFAISGIIGTWILESNITRIIGIIASNGVFVSLYFLVMLFLIKQSKKPGGR